MLKLFRMAMLILCSSGFAGRIDLQKWSNIAVEGLITGATFASGNIIAMEIKSKVEDVGRTALPPYDTNSNYKAYQALFNKFCEYMPNWLENWEITTKVIKTFLFTCLFNGVFFGISTLYWAYLGNLTAGIMLSFVCYQLIGLFIDRMLTKEPVDRDYIMQNLLQTVCGLASIFLYSNFGFVVVLGMLIGKALCSDNLKRMHEQEIIRSGFIIVLTSISVTLQSNVVFKPICDFFIADTSKFFFWMRNVLYSVSILMILGTVLLIFSFDTFISEENIETKDRFIIFIALGLLAMMTPVNNI